MTTVTCRRTRNTIRCCSIESTSTSLTTLLQSKVIVHQSISISMHNAVSYISYHSPISVICCCFAQSFVIFFCVFVGVSRVFRQSRAAAFAILILFLGDHRRPSSSSEQTPSITSSSSPLSSTNSITAYLTRSHRFQKDTEASMSDTSERS